MKNKFKEIEECRVCKSKDLQTVLDIGTISVSNFLSESNKNNDIQAPLELVLCRGNCNLLQLKHTVNSDMMFRQYWYLSGINNSMKDELLDIVKSVEHLHLIKDEDYIIDIGSNDGTLLNYYESKKIKRVGFEPALNLKSKNSNLSNNIISDYFSLEGWNKHYEGKKARVITAIGMFYDLPDPNKFVFDVEKILHKNGIFIIQMMYLPLFIQKNAFDGICHEHLEYYSLFSLEYLLDQHNLKIVGLDIRNDINEGSGRFFITKKDCSSKLKLPPDLIENLIIYRKKELALKLDEIQIYNKLKQNINIAKEKTINFLKSEKQKGKLIHGYAASTKGNTTLQYYGITSNLIEAISDRNSDKWGKYTSGSKIPVISEKDSRSKKPDYYFVLAWHFIENFIEREFEFLENGGKFIVSMPSFKVIDIHNFKQKKFKE